MCICINCRFLDDCVGYYKVELKHNEPHLNETPSFYPHQPIVNVMLNHEKEIEWDVIDCLSFSELPGYWQNFY